MNMKIDFVRKILPLSCIASILFLLLSITKTSFAAESWNITKITSGDVAPSSLRLQSSNNGFGLVWVDTRPNSANIYFAPIKILGNRLLRVGKEVKLTYDAKDETPSLVWNEQDYALFWSHERSQIYFARFKENGKKMIENKSLEIQSRGYAIHVSAVWNGEEYGITWWDVRDAPTCNPSGTRGRAFFARVNNNGEMIGEEIPVSDAFSNPWQDYNPLIVWDGENYAIFWGDSREGGECTGTVSNLNTYMAKVNRNGEKILGDIKLDKATAGYSQLESVIWDGNNYVITYRGSVTRAFLAKMDRGGNTNFSNISINTVAFGSGTQISWDGKKYYITWSDGRDRSEEIFDNIEIYYTMFDTDGNSLTPETRLTYHDATQSQNTQILFTKTSMGLAFLDNRDGSPQVYFASNLANYPKLSLPQKPPKPSIPTISIPRPIRPFR